jgi:hypothetical protein
MKQLLVAFGVTLAGVGLIAGTGVASASPEPPPGYVTNTVKDAGLTVAVPETFTVIHLTREQAKAALEANTQLRGAGATVDDLRHFTAVGDFDGDGSGDFSIEVAVSPKARLASPEGARRRLETLGYRDVSVSRTRVAGHRALVSNYVGERFGPDSTRKDHFTEYMFKSPLDAVIAVAFDRPPSDMQHEDMIETMIKSVRFVSN